MTWVQSNILFPWAFSWGLLWRSYSNIPLSLTACFKSTYPQLGSVPVEDQWLCSEPLLNAWAPDPISESRQPSEEAHSHSSSHYTQLVVTDESGDANQQLGLHTQLFLQHNRSGYQTRRPLALGSTSKFCPSKVINTGQLWQSPATTDNECGLLLTIQTLISLQLYRHQTVPDSGPDTPSSQRSFN